MPTISEPALLDTSAPEPVDFDDRSRAVFSLNYNRASFVFTHDLRDNSLFTLENILELARRQPHFATHAYWSNGDVSVDDGWGAGEGSGSSLEATLASIATNNSLVMLKHVEQDSLFGPAVQRIQQTVVDLAGPRMREDVMAGRGTLLIASPRRITSYHIDSDVNFLFQISGDKLFSVFDQRDRTLTPADELENYYLGDTNGAVFKPARQKDAHSYQLRAGLGVHVPSLAAHWAQNLDSPSIALSINFDLRSASTAGRIYRLNGRLRRHGFHPLPPGVSKWRDILKITALASFDAARRLGGAASPKNRH